MIPEKERFGLTRGRIGMTLNNRFVVDTEFTQTLQQFEEIPERIQNVIWSDAIDVSIEMTEAAKALLPNHWLLRADLMPRAFWTGTQGRKSRSRPHQRRIYATISFATGFRDVRSDGFSSKPRRKKGEPLLPFSMPRKYAWHHDQGGERTRARHVISVPKSRFGPILVSRVQASLAAILGGST